MALHRSPLPSALAALLASTLGCQLDVSESLDDAFGVHRTPLELDIELPSGVSEELVSVGIFPDTSLVADGRQEDGTERVVSGGLWIQADGQLGWDAGDEGTVEAWVAPSSSSDGQQSVEFPGSIVDGSGVLVAWIDQDRDGRLRLAADGSGEPVAVPRRPFRNTTLVLTQVNVDGTRWSGRRASLDPNDTSAVDGSDIQAAELDGWIARF